VDLRSSVLAGVGFSTVDHIITATNAPSANEATNYQRLEFFGDSVLKFLVSAHLFKARGYWPEGYLSRGRDQMVANSRLARAALETGLDPYIVTEPFTARKWKPKYISDYTEVHGTEKRTLSTKVLADVVEALVGGAFLDGGLEKAAACTAILLPELSALELSFSIHSGRSIPHDDGLLGLTSFLYYEFRDGRLLREALTHPSCQRDAGTLSYQRLEFLGDAVLDMLLISYLAKHARTLPHGRMHLTKAAMVNAGFLAYLCLNSSVEQEVVDVRSSRDASSYVFKEQRSVRSLNLSRFMRYQSPDIDSVLHNCEGRYERLQPDIKNCLQRGFYYPWDLFASLAPEKFLSDIVESMFGAIYLDSAGDLVACERFAERLGLLEYLRRVIDEDIDLRHPKNILGELAGQSTVEYAVDLKDGYSCTVKVGGVDVTSVFGGSTPDEVMTRAAHTAVGLLTAN
jgi:dsRNA-specific ribonuclease